MKRTIERNRQMKKIAQSVAQKWEKATIHSIDGDRANIRLGTSSNLIRHVEVTGDASLLAPGQEVVIVWKDNRPVVVQSGAALAASIADNELSDETPLFIWISQTVAQSLATGVDTYLLFDHTLADTVGWWDPTNPDRVVIQEDGLYLISAECAFVGNATGLREIRIYVNDDEVSRKQIFSGTASAVVIEGTAIVMLEAGDYVQTLIYQNSGGALSTSCNANFSDYPSMRIVRIKNTVTIQQTGDTTVINQGSGGTSGPHAATHEAGGADMINVQGLRGVLAEAQNADQFLGRAILDVEPTDGQIYAWSDFMQSWAPTGITIQMLPAHGSTHAHGAPDEINVNGLSGTLADPQNANQIQGRSISTATPTDGQALGWNGATSQWEPKTVSGGGISSSPFGLSIILGDGSLTMSTGMKGYIEVPYNCTLTEVRLYSDVSGSCVIDIWKGTYASLPASGGTICSSTKPALSSQQTYQDTALTGWTKSLMAGDVLAINVVSATTVKQVTLSLKGTKS